MQRFRSWTTRLGIAALASSLGIGCVALLSFAQEGTTAKEGAPAKQAPGEKPKTFEFEYRDAPWEQVLNFLADNCRMPVLGSQRPQGTFTFVSPTKARYTIPQIVDILNSKLITSKMLIIREPDKFVVISTEDQTVLDMEPLLRLQVDDLEVDKPYDQQRYGRSELAQVNFKLNTLTPEEAETNLAANKSPFGKMAKIPKANSILVTDTVNNLRRMKKLLDDIDAGGGEKNMEVFQLRGTADGETLKKTLDSTFGGGLGKPNPDNAPVITFDATSNKLLVKATKAQLAEIRGVLTSFGAIRPTVATKPPEPGAPQPTPKTPTQEAEEAIRIIPVKTDLGKSSTVSDYVSNCAYMLESLRSNPVEVTLEPVLPQRLEELRKGAKVAEKKQGKEQLSEGKEQKPKPTLQNKPGKPDKPILLAPMNRIDAVMVGSDDPEAIDFAEQILGYLTKSGDDNYEIIPLKNASAQTVKDTLEELLIGKKQQGPMMGMPFMMGGGNLREQATGPTIRLAADKRSNSIIVRAPRQIIVTIKRFIETELDLNNIDQKLQPKPQFWKLEHATASDVVDVIKELYKDYMDQNQRGSTISPFGPFGPRVPNPNQQQESDRTIRLTVSANTKDNGVIAYCPDVLYDELDYLITRLDYEAKEPNSSIKVFRFGKKIDPVTLQAVMNVITGNNTQVPGTNTNGANNFQNRFGPGGFGGGGFGRGGGGFGGNGFGGGGGGRGGGGGGPRGGMGPRGGNRSAEPPHLISESPPGGSDFFAGRVTDDPRKPVQQLIFDDQDNSDDKILSTQAQTQPTSTAQPPGRPPSSQPGAQNPAQQPPNITANTRGNVNIIVTPEGNVIVTGSKEDIETIGKLLELMAQEQAPVETELRLFKLKYYDPTSMVNLLNAIYARYNPSTGVIGAAQARPGGFGGAPGGGAPGGGGGGGGFLGNLLAQAAQGSQNTGVTPAGGSGSILLLAIPRLNSILIGAPKSLFPEIEKTIEMFDKPNTSDANAKIIPLKRANAIAVANLLTQFYAQRYPNEPQQSNQFRVTADAKTNSLIVQAGPADLKEAQELIEFFDKAETKVVNQFRIKTLKFAVASDMATLMQQALSQAIFQNTPSTGTTPGQGGLGQPGGGLFGQPNLFGGQQGGGGPFGGNQGGGLFGANRPGGGLGTGLGGAQQGQVQRGVNLQFAQGAQRFQTGLLEDVGFFPDVRTNRLIISAPPESIDLIEKLVEELDVPPTLIADVKVFRLKKTDATQAANTLQQIYFGTGTTGTGTTGRPGGFGAPGGTGLGGTQQPLNTQLSAGQGPQAIQMRFAVDTRTNSLIVAGSRGDVLLAEVLLNQLESSDIRDREYRVYRLRNNQSQNVATILGNFFSSEISILGNAAELSNFTAVEHQITVYADTTNNSIAIAASPRFMPEVMKIVEQLDVELAQVAIQVLIAQITLDNFDEMGIEVGLQSPVLFQRSVTGMPPTPGTPGFLFNNNSATLPNATVADPGQVGWSGVTNYNTGRQNATSGLGGFVFSASSDGLSVLVRALRTQGRLEVLSRPQVITRDNQQALISVGQQVPIITGSTIGTAGNIVNTVDQQQVGVILKVLPQISPDGRVVMRVEPQISSVSNATVDLGNGTRGTIIDQTIASTTIDAHDGSTVAIGGLLTKMDQKTQNSVPWLGDLPYLGALFRYRSQTKKKTELLILLTPHIIRTQADAERIFMTEASRMSWTLADVQAMHGSLPGASFLQGLHTDTDLPTTPMINPFDSNFVTPAPAPDEKLKAPAKTPVPPQPQPPGTQPQLPPWLLPPGVTPPPPQPGMPIQNQSWQNPQQYPINNNVTGLPPQTMNQQQARSLSSMPPSQPIQTEQNGKWTTTVIYGPPGTGWTNSLPVNPQNQTQPVNTNPSGFAGGQ